jgi:hypothetical protein
MLTRRREGIRVLSCVGHAEHEWLGVLQLEVLIGELLTVD